MAKNNFQRSRPPHLYMVKPFKYLIPENQWPWDLVCNIGDVVSARFAQMMNLA